MGAARRLRVQRVAEDADEPTVLSQWYEPPPAEPLDWHEDALDHAVRFADIRPDWHCDSCGQRVEGREFACGYCGDTRTDIDL